MEKKDLHQQMKRACCCGNVVMIDALPECGSLAPQERKLERFGRTDSVGDAARWQECVKLGLSSTRHMAGVLCAMGFFSTLGNQILK